MNYRPDKYGNQISTLGFGCMRLPQKLGRIDMEAAKAQIKAAFDAGVNYFDTAYIYPGSEAALGQILQELGIRDKVYIATKLPHYLIRSREGLEKLFQEELRRLRTDHVDFYLMHMLTDLATWERMKALGIEDWLKEKQQAGQIRQVGFSYHGNSDMFCRLADARSWDFCMIQYNYMDEHTQAGRRGLQYAHSKGMPVMIMEPLRGGKLVNMLPPEALELFAAHPAGHSPAGWAFRWLWNQPEVTCVLSGMNSLEMVAENTKAAAEANAGDLGDREQEMLRQVAAAINRKMKVGCTGCGYCTPCPKGVDIPGIFAIYNRKHTESAARAKIEYMMCTAFRRESTGAEMCIDCGKCEQHCPQAIPIRQVLKDARKELEGPVCRIARPIVKKFKIF